MNFKTALNKSEALCSRREYCKADILKKLEKWEIPETDCQIILDHLVNENFINESRYASFYVRDKVKFNRWGRKKIWWQLKQKGVPPEIINEELAHIDNKEYRLKLNEVVEAKYRQVKNRDYMKQKSAIIRNAVSKGYEYQDVIPLVEELLRKNNH
jgi:regulatory protein